MVLRSFSVAKYLFMCENTPYLLLMHCDMYKAHKPVSKQEFMHDPTLQHS